MIPKIARGGSSFKGAFRYYMHDKGADTSDRVSWTRTENMHTQDPGKAWKVMAYTAREQDRLKEASGQSRAGRKLEKPVFAFSLAWHPEQDPDPDHMLDTARKAIEMLGLSEHEAVVIAHRDEPQRHVHVIINRVHPLTGLAGDIRNSKRKFSDFAREYERENGKIYCQQREDNFEKREDGESTRYRELVIAEAWKTTNSGQGFVEALEAKGYTLAQGRKRLVIVDPYGKTHNPTRHIKGVRSKEFHARLRDLDLSLLPDADKLESHRQKFAKSAGEQQEGLDDIFSMQFNVLQKKHLLERDKLSLEHERLLDSAKRRLVKYYRLPQQKRQFVELSKRTKHPSWWKRLFGIARRDRERLEEIAFTYKNSIWRYREKIDSIKNPHIRDTERLAKTQKGETLELQSLIEKQLTARPRAPRQSGPSKSRIRSNSKNGPDRGL